MGSSVPVVPTATAASDQQPLVSAGPAEPHSDSTPWFVRCQGSTRSAVALAGQATPSYHAGGRRPRHPVACRAWRPGSFLRPAGGCPMVRGRPNV